MKITNGTRRTVMNAAWALRREDKTDMSVALRSAWATQKIQMLADEDGMSKGYDHFKVNVNYWRKNGRSRTYIEIRLFNARWQRKKTINCGYVDNMTGTVIDGIYDLSPKPRRKTTKKAAKKVDTQKTTSSIDSIPGVEELRKAYAAASKWKAAFNHMVESGDSWMPSIAHLSDSEMDELESKYPDAVFALEVEDKAVTTSNYQMSSAYNKALDGLKTGKAVADVRTTLTAELKSITERAMWF